MHLVSLIKKSLLFKELCEFCNFFLIYFELYMKSLIKIQTVVKMHPSTFFYSLLKLSLRIVVLILTEAGSRK